MPYSEPAPPRHYSATAHAARNLLVALDALGADPEELLDAAGLTPPDLDTLRARIPRAVLSAVWERAAEVIPDPLLGLRVGATVPLGWWGLPERLALHSPALGEGIAAAVEFARLMADDKRFSLDRHGDRAAFVLQLGGGVPPAPSPGWRHHAEADLAYAVRLVRTAVSPAFTPAEVWFTHEAPAGGVSELHERLLSKAVRFGRPANALHFDVSWLRAPVVTAVPVLRVPLEIEAARELASVEVAETVSDRAGRYIRVDPASVSVADVAERLGMSKRTLQRRLREEGTSFATLLDSVRREYAAALLATPAVPLSEVSYRLGFSEPSAFHRAAKRWFGATAKEYRASQMPR